MSMQSLRVQRGLSIVELMVALLLASILTLGLGYVFVTNSQTFRTNESQARVQEAGRTSTDILARAIRNADHWGCAQAFGGGDGVDSMLNEGDGFESDLFLNGLAGESDVGDDHEDFDNVLPGSDIVMFGGMEGAAGLSLDQHTPISSATIWTGEDSDEYFDEGDVILINDCKAANMLQITNFQSGGIVANTGGSQSPGNATQRQNDFQRGASVFQPTMNAFYIRQTFDEDGNESRALVFNSRENGSGGGTVGTWSGPVELVGNVWDMRLEFGRDTGGNGRVDTWSAPGPDDEADETIAIRFSFLVRSPQEDVVEEAQSYCFPGWLDCEDNNGLRTQAEDERLYRVYTSTATLRNRMEQ